MKVVLLLVLLLSPAALYAQQEETLPPAVFTDAKGRYQIEYPASWQLRKGVDGAEATFYATAARPAPAYVTLTTQLLPIQQKDLKLTLQGGQDSVWRSIQRLPRAQVLGLEQQDLGSYEEIRYEYLYTHSSATPTRLHVVGRRVWRGGYQFQIEYRGEAREDAQYLADGKELVDSFAFTEKAWSSLRYAAQVCDNKFYGIAATGFYNGRWEDDCRTIHEFPANDLTAAPKVHRKVLPFQSYALAKGFDNCLYSVTKAPTDTPEYVYRYDPVTRKGAYTTWQLPAQGSENVWISAATDDRGDLYFNSSDGNLLVKVTPSTGKVAVVWFNDPLQKAPFYYEITFPGAGTHGNFCLDDANTMYRVYSTDGSLLKVNLKTGRPSPERMKLDGLPKRGGYSDLLMQNDAAGRRRLYLAGPKAVYQVDMARRRATLVRKGTYTDLAGCNLFQVPPRAAPAPPPPATATWRGRVLNAATYQPLPQTQLRLGTGFGTIVRLNPNGTFSYQGKPGTSYAYHAQLTGYIALDSTWTAGPGPYVRDILLQPLSVGTTVALDNVQFEQGQAVLLPTSFPALNKLVALLSDNPAMTIELRGHTDNVGPPEKNVVLSEQRVGTVKAYLVERGIAESRIAGVGFGGAQPTASNDQEHTRKLNRRVEFRITGFQ
ncbi:OmpA family protein [Hymenobacter arizonensis]|uniref:OmpA family protein n=1 Tax=Hymenobacter arizonensis TaxID=1227077 RepID=A0A1I5X2C2_HYMAR|nr:OmpA family protein [Hymenobacter arizonensis]SFQ26078.1 OmpA family protein [Hymenobacter arizonensis]